MTDVRGESGFTLVELMVAMVLMLIVLGAVLTTFNESETTARTAQLRAEAEDRARQGVNTMARTLRNQVSTASPGSQSFERSLPYDVVALTFDRNASGANARGLRRIRYCLDSTNPASGRVITQTQTWTTAATPAMPAGTGCPATGYTSTQTLVSGVANRRDGLDRPVWSYTSTVDGGVTTVSGIDVSLFMTVDAKRKTELTLRSGIALRNANRPPVAAYTATPLNGAVVLNASPSDDPENGPLRYEWFVGTTPIGTTQRLEYGLTAPTAIRLRITDSGDLTSEYTQTVGPA